MSDNQKILGQTGETLASLFLQARGYTILETNYRTKRSEIDIIATKRGTICFIEVKTRQSLAKGLPRESVNYPKQQKILLGANTYLQKNAKFNSKIRFDVIEVIKKDDSFDIHLIKHAFQAD
ncbi:MAG: YraN family protein [Pseudomonadota bacterium]